MARLEDLIKDIADPSLRNQIAGEKLTPCPRTGSGRRRKKNGSE